MSTGWATPDGYPPGIKQKILASDIDETKKMRQPHAAAALRSGTYTTEPFIHDHWEGGLPAVRAISPSATMRRGKGGEIRS